MVLSHWWTRHVWSRCGFPQVKSHRDSFLFCGLCTIAATLLYGCPRSAPPRCELASARHVHRRRLSTPASRPPLLRYAPQLRSSSGSTPSTGEISIAPADDWGGVTESARWRPRRCRSARARAALAAVAECFRRAECAAKGAVRVRCGAHLQMRRQAPRSYLFEAATMLIHRTKRWSPLQPEVSASSNALA